MRRRAVAATAWALGALLFTTLLVAVFRVDHVGLPIEAAVAALAILAAIAPAVALPIAAVTVPVAAFTISRYANGAVGWAETIAIAALAGSCAHALTPAGRARRLHPSLLVPAVVFGALTIASMVVSLAVMRLRLGPVFTDVLVAYLTRTHAFDTRSFPALRAGLLLMEGVMLCSVAARECERRPAVLARIIAASAGGAALAAAINVWLLLRSAARSGTFWPSLVKYASEVRWNVPYGDFNAAGSYFVLGALLAAAAALGTAGVRRAAWAAACALIVVALWLTGSRAAVLAAVLGLAGAIAVRQVGRAGTRRLRQAAAVTAIACVLGVGLTLALPERGNQKSTVTAADVRVGLVRTSARMIASRPVFGIGLGEYYQRSGEFSSPALLSLFPVAVHENAHNNFLQVAAELGLSGGLVFAWLVGVVLALAARGAARGQGASAVVTAGALAGFVLSWLGGHPLLIPEVACAFWIVAGAVAGAATSAHAPLAPLTRWRTVLAAALLFIAVTLPFRIQARLHQADLEHVGIGVTGWTTEEDTERYRTAVDSATLFVPADSGFRIRLKPMSDQAVRVELRLDGRVADVIVLAPGQWNDVYVPRRSERAQARFSRLDLRIVTPADRPVTIRMTKVVPVS